MANKNLFRHKAVAVRWLDAHARNQAVEYTENEVDNYHRAEEVITLGLIIKDDEAGISLYTEETGPSDIRGLSFIPRGMITEVIPLGRLSPTRKPRHAKKTPAPVIAPSSSA